MTQQPNKLFKVMLNLVGMIAMVYIVYPLTMGLAITLALGIFPTTSGAFINLVITSVTTRILVEYVVTTIGDTWYATKYNKQK